MRLCHCSHLSVYNSISQHIPGIAEDRVFIFPGGVFIFGAVLKHIQVLSNLEIRMGYDSKLSKQLYN
jgi:exopolyphosphatase/pppGpp-phosphohydrolase